MQFMVRKILKKTTVNGNGCTRELVDTKTNPKQSW